MSERRTLVLDNSRRDAWVEWLISHGEVVAPRRATGGDVHYDVAGSSADVLWDFDNSLLPPKQFLLPQVDRLMRIERRDGHVSLAACEDAAPRILLNLRSCDASGLAFLTRVHGMDLVDAAVLRRRARLAVIALACTRPFAQCFCVCTDSGPFLAGDFDLQLVDLGARLLVEVGSSRGEELLGGDRFPFLPASEAELALRAELERKARDSFGEPTCHFASAMRRVSTGRVEDGLWAEMGDWCVECGGCNFACPTCYCFSVKDRACDGGWERCRTWDSCQYAAFTLEASGHNPRPRKADRMKRRFFHKVSAQYAQRDGQVGCVGCGRCIRVCMGTTDMPAVVTAIRRGAWHG